MAEDDSRRGCVYGCMGAVLLVAVIAVVGTLVGGGLLGGALVFMQEPPGVKTQQGEELRHPELGPGEPVKITPEEYEEALEEREEPPSAREAPGAETREAPGAETQPPPDGDGSSSAAPPAPAPATPAPAAGETAKITVDGGARVALLQSGRRFTVPGDVPPGRYTIEATFPGEQPVAVGTLQVRSGGAHAITCNPGMGICRGR